MKVLKSLGWLDEDNEKEVDWEIKKLVCGDEVNITDRKEKVSSFQRFRNILTKIKGNDDAAKPYDNEESKKP